MRKADIKTSFNLPDDPWSLRVVPVADNGTSTSIYRDIVYRVTKLDGISLPNGTWYVVEHQTNHGLTHNGLGTSGGELPCEFDDTLGGIGLGPTLTHQTFSISQKQGLTPVPTFDKIIVHTQKGDFAILWESVSGNGTLVNDYYRWPGVPTATPNGTKFCR